MRISHEVIYQALYVEGRGALKRELVTCLRTGRALHVPRARNRQKAWGMSPRKSLSVSGPWKPTTVPSRGTGEGDLIIGLERSAIGTLVDRPARFAMLVHLPREEGYRQKQSVKNALAATMSTLPDQVRRSLTWDRGKELSAHVAFKVKTGIPVFFADPHSPWQHDTKENTNRLLRQYFPKDTTDLSRWNNEEIQAVAAALNGRPPKSPWLEDSR